MLCSSALRAACLSGLRWRSAAASPGKQVFLAEAGPTPWPSEQDEGVGPLLLDRGTRTLPSGWRERWVARKGARVWDGAQTGSSPETAETRGTGGLSPPTLLVPVASLSTHGSVMSLPIPVLLLLFAGGGNAELVLFPLQGCCRSRGVWEG